MRSLSTLLLALSMTVFRASAADSVLIFAPHPDDETLGCSGIIQQAVARGTPITIVLVTNGDGFPAAASGVTRKPVSKLAAVDFLELSRFRQTQARTAVTLVGAKAKDLVLLGYPDSLLEKMYQANNSTPVRQEFTGKSETYGLIQPDFHTTAHGKAAPYTRAAAVADAVELIRKTKPTAVYVTDEADSHKDHRATFWIVRDAVKSSGYKGAFYTYVVHSGEEWPWPRGITPERPFEVHQSKGQQVPAGVVWPPTHRVPLTPEQAALKRKAIAAHILPEAEDPKDRQPGEREYLESFVKSEEIFWIVRGK